MKIQSDITIMTMLKTVFFFSILAGVLSGCSSNSGRYKNNYPGHTGNQHSYPSSANHHGHSRDQHHGDGRPIYGHEATHSTNEHDASHTTNQYYDAH